MGDYHTLRNTPSSRRRKKKQEPFFGDDGGPSRTCLPSFKFNKKNRVFSSVGSTVSSDPLLNHVKINTLADDPSTATNATSPPPTPTNHRVVTRLQEKEQPQTVTFFPSSNSYRQQRRYQSSRDSSSTHPRRPVVYEGERQPQESHGQETVDKNTQTLSSQSLPIMRSFKEGQCQTPFIVSSLTDVEEESGEEDGSLNYNTRVNDRSRLLQLERELNSKMSTELMPSLKTQPKENQEPISLPSSDTLDLTRLEQDLMRMANAVDYEAVSSEEEDEFSADEPNPASHFTLRAPEAGGTDKRHSPTVSLTASKEESIVFDESGIIENPSFTLIPPLSGVNEGGSKGLSTSTEGEEKQVPHISGSSSGLASPNPESKSQQKKSSLTDHEASYPVGKGSSVAYYESSISSCSPVSGDFNHSSLSSALSPLPSSQGSSPSPKRRNLQHLQQENVEELNASALHHMEMGEYNHALRLFEAVLQAHLAQYGNVHPLVARTRHNLGLVHSKRALVFGNGALKHEVLTESLKQFQAAARCARDSLGRNHPNVADSLVRIGFILMDCREFEKAVITFEEALRIRREYYGEEHLLVANLLNDLGVCYTYLGNWESALDMTVLAVGSQRSMLRASQDSTKLHLELADTLCNMGGLYLERMQHSTQSSRFVEWARHAVSAFREALDIRQRVLQDGSHKLVIQARSLHDEAQSM